MITAEMRAEIRRLVLREGWKIETVARRFAIHHSVVRRAIADAPEGATAPPVASALEPFKPYLVERLTLHPELSATRLLLEIRDRGYARSVAILRRYVAKVRAPRAKKAYLRVETEPGEVAQVDWGSFGHMRIGQTHRPLSAFAIVLKWSRALYVDFSLDQRMVTFLRMHARAFAFFGGVPRKVIYDNLKSVVLHHVGTTVQFNPAFLAFAGHLLFEPVAAPVRYPQAKGNVEGAINCLVCRRRLQPPRQLCVPLHAHRPLYGTQIDRLVQQFRPGTGPRSWKYRARGGELNHRLRLAWRTGHPERRRSCGPVGEWRSTRRHRCCYRLERPRA